MPLIQPSQGHHDPVKVHGEHARGGAELPEYADQKRMKGKADSPLKDCHQGNQQQPLIMLDRGNSVHSLAHQGDLHVVWNPKRRAEGHQQGRSTEVPKERTQATTTTACFSTSVSHGT